MVVSFLAETRGQEVVDRAVADAGVTDIAGLLEDDSAWFSYGQVRALLEATVRVVGNDALREAAVAGRLHDESRVEMTQMLQDFGSPANLLRSVYSYESGSRTSFGMATIMEYGGESWRRANGS